MTIREPRWIEARLVDAVHRRQLAEHGGSIGVRDRGALATALARPRQRFAHGGEDVDLPALAAAYACGVMRNQPFVDGNRRTAYVLCRTFLRINDWDLVGPLAERYAQFLGLAAGDVGEDELADWIRAHARPDAIHEPAGEYG
ncbi:MAG: Fic family protein [Halofilum sp. (in: g-proteobacteria)]|nr:Fic family protein [Halofilum sp. (in: g-proteobacteria)]